MTREVILSPEARTDLQQLCVHITGQSGDARALAHAGRIGACCLGFADIPERGSRRDDLRPGLHTAGFEHRVTIAFTVTADAVIFLRILYGGRDLRAAFADDTRDAD